MEKFRTRIPEALLRRIEGSTECGVPCTMSCLSAFFNDDPIFHQILAPLSLGNTTTCAKDQQEAATLKCKGNESFRCKSFDEAVIYFTEALRFIPVCRDTSKDIAILYTNRAACLHKLGLLSEGERDCTRALSHEESYAKAWYRRGCIRKDMLNYLGAVEDLEFAIAYEPSTSGKDQVRQELEALKKVALGGSSQSSSLSSTSVRSREPEVKTELYRDTMKGWGLRTTADVQPGVLVHLEEAMAAIVLKDHRDSHCHYCFEALPADRVPCKGCAVSFYCSDACRDDAADEHEFECGGTSWAAVIPTDAALACRLLKHDSQAEGLCHHYDQLSGNGKVELHLLGIVTATCLNVSASSHFAAISVKDLASKIVILIAKVRSNAMAITHIASSSNAGRDPVMLSGIEHVNVAQGVFLRGSKFNHTCDPKIHASYIKRRLFVRASHFLPAGSPLELSYGAQLGDSGSSSRQSWLKQRYFFSCKCQACTDGTVADRLLAAYRCGVSACDGIVLESKERHFEFPVGRCLKCDTMLGKHDLRAAEKCLQEIESLDSTESCKYADNILDRALQTQQNGRRYLHRFSKQLGRMEDIIARLYCAAEQPSLALHHCEKSTEILKHVYGNEHIVVAFELVKLASLARLCDGKTQLARRSLEEANTILSNYYGVHYRHDFPQMWSLVDDLRNQH